MKYLKIFELYKKRGRNSDGSVCRRYTLEEKEFRNRYDEPFFLKIEDGNILIKSEQLMDEYKKLEDVLKTPILDQTERKILKSFINEYSDDIFTNKQKEYANLLNNIISQKKIIKKDKTVNMSQKLDTVSKPHSYYTYLKNPWRNKY